MQNLKLRGAIGGLEIGAMPKNIKKMLEILDKNGEVYVMI